MAKCHPRKGGSADSHLFDKSDRDELKERSKIGSIFTIITFLFGGAALVYHDFAMVRPEVYRELLINTAFTNEDEQINFSVSVEVDLPCHFLHVDSLDLLGYSQLNGNTTMTHRRMNANGTIIGISNSTHSDSCMPRYGLLPDDQCCSSCEQLLLPSIFDGRRPSQKS
jgi:hypothetical protein